MAKTKLIIAYWLPILIAGLLGPAGAAAQGVTVRGRVLDAGQQPLPGVTILLLDRVDSTVRYTAASEGQGRFQVAGVTPGQYRLQARLLGFQSQTQPLTVGAGTALDVAPLVLREDRQALKEVRVTASKSAFTLEPDKLMVNVAQSATASGSTVLEVLRRTPGVSIDQDGLVQLKGSAAVSVLIDGKPTYLSAEQLSHLLAGMSAGNIQSIEVSSTPAAQYDAAGTAGTINIITKKNTAPGYAVDFVTSLSLARYLLPQESVTGNIRTRHFNVFGSFDYSRYRTYQRLSSTQRTTDAASAPLTLQRDGLHPNQTHFYTYRAGLDYYLTPRQQLGVVYTGTTDLWRKDYRTTTVLSSNGQPTSQLLSRDYAVEPFYNNIVNVNYQFKPDTTGRLLTADADYINYRNYADGFLLSTRYNLAGEPLEPVQQLNFRQPVLIDIRSLKVDGTYPVRGYVLKSGLKYADVRTDNDFSFDSVRNEMRVFAPSLSNHFRYTERVAAAYLSGKRRFGKTTVDAGLRAEHTNADAHLLTSGQRRRYRYLTLFPTLVLNQRLGERHQVGLALSRRINRPTYTSLNPIRDYYDRNLLYQGNPNLIAETSWSTALSYRLLDTYSASLTYIRASNFIARTLLLDPATNVLTISYANYAHRDRLELLLLAPFTVASFWEVNTSATLSYSAYPVPELRGLRPVERVAVDLFAANTLRLPGGTTVELSARYRSPTLGGVYLLHPYFSLDGGAKKSLLKDKLDVRLAVNDALHTAWPGGTSLNRDAPYRFRNVTNTRRVSLKLSYHLGGKLNTGQQRHAEEEKRL